jgi:putative hydrolase of HD superfamily
MGLTSADHRLIETLDRRFPQKNIKNNFNVYAALPPALRLDQAMQDLKKMNRSGWVRIGVPPEIMQNVAQHQESAAHFILVATHGREIKEARKAAEMLLHHDTTEGPPGDFTPNDAISKEEKNKIEEISARLIFEAFPLHHRNWRDFEDNAHPASPLAHDGDQGEMLTRALYNQEHAPHLRGALKPFWIYAKERIKTERIMEVYHELEEAGNGGRPSPVYEAMKAHYKVQK